MFIVDSHCHLDALDYENLHKILLMLRPAQARDVKRHLLAIERNIAVLKSFTLS